MNNFTNQAIEFVHLDYRKLQFFQGDLKKVDKSEFQKLEASLKSKGNFDIIRVWRKGKQDYILDGHTRVRYFQENKIKFDGKYLVPCIRIHAESEQDAKEKLLLINAQYGEITKDGLAQFVGKEISADWFNTYIRFNNIDNFQWLDQVQNQQKMLSEDLLNEPVIITPADTLVANRDIYTLPQEEDEETERAPSATDNDYSNFSLVMQHPNKVKLENTLDDIRTAQGFDKREEALMYLVSLYN